MEVGQPIFVRSVKSGEGDLEIGNLQVLQNKIRHHLPHVLYQYRIGDTVARFGIEHQLNLLTRLLQLIEKLQRVCHVHVVIGCSVN